MSGLEIAAAVAAIVSGCSSARSLFERWRTQQRKDDDYGKSFERDLADCARKVQSQYDESRRKYGASFAIGDDLSTSSFIHVQLVLDTEVIQLLTDAVENNTFISIQPLREGIKIVHEQAITILVEQGGRLQPVSRHSGSWSSPTVRMFKWLPGQVHLGIPRPNLKLSIVTVPPIRPIFVRMGMSIGNLISHQGHRAIARRKGAQQYCSGAVWVQQTGVAKAGVNRDRLGCPDCYWDSSS